MPGTGKECLWNRKGLKDWELGWHFLVKEKNSVPFKNTENVRHHKKM